MRRPDGDGREKLAPNSQSVVRSRHVDTACRLPVRIAIAARYGDARGVDPRRTRDRRLQGNPRISESRPPNETARPVRTEKITTDMPAGLSPSRQKLEHATHVVGPPMADHGKKTAAVTVESRKPTQKRARPPLGTTVAR